MINMQSCIRHLSFLIAFVLFQAEIYEGTLFHTPITTKLTHRSHRHDLGSTFASDKAGEIDEQLYSRQLLVYGKSAQQLLSTSTVGIIVFDRNNQSIHSAASHNLATEIVKNLALSGIGKLFVKDWSEPSLSRSLLGQASTILDYAQELNPRLKVHTTDDIASMHDTSCDLIIAVGGTFNDLLALNEECRQHGRMMIASDVKGVSGYLFNDFLEDFEVKDVDGEPLRRKPVATVTRIDDHQQQYHSDKNRTGWNEASYMMEIECIEEEVLSLGLGDAAHLIWRDSNEHQHKIRVKVLSIINRRVVRVSCDDKAMKSLLYDAIDKRHAFSIDKVKDSVIFTHASLRQQLRSPSFAACNGCLAEKQDRAMNLVLLSCFLAAGYVNVALSSKEVFRRRVVAKLAGLGIKDATASIKSGGVGAELLDRISYGFYRSARRGGACPATVSIIGSLVAQEAIKAITRVHRPAQQFLLFESLDALLPVDHNDDNVNEDDDGDDIVACVYGSKLAQELKRLRIFIVGAGAIGSELLKTFALLGVGEKLIADDGVEDYECDDDDDDDVRQGELHLTDMDSIERSNLNRQLLFREKDVGQPKSIVAAAAVKRINPHINIQAYTHAVGTSTEHIFDAQFWNNIDIIATALDNIDARRYIDAQAVMRGKWLLDSGTLGTKGNIQVVIPFLTESYASTSDPPEEAIPLCTIKSFPYQPDHTVAWARSVFDQLFSNDFDYINRELLPATSTCISSHNSQRQVDDILLSLPIDDRHRLSGLIQTLSMPTIDAVLEWALQLFIQYFIIDVKKLQAAHPIDSIDEESGMLFWTGSRRYPKPLSSFNIADDTHQHFVIHAATILLRICGVSCSMDDVITRLRVMTYEKIIDDTYATNAPTTIDMNQWRQLHNTASSYHLEGESFEKDDLSLGHVDFVAAASDLRSRVYGIPPIEGGRLGVQHLAGKIIPALPTTTAITAGLVCHELIKIAGEMIMMRRLAKVKETGAVSTSVAVEEVISESIDDQTTSNYRILRSFSYWKSRFRISVPRIQDDEQKPSNVEDAEDEEVEDTPSLPQPKSYFLSSKARILHRFRNSFINIARPLLSFVEPVEAGAFEVNEESFTSWDMLHYDADNGLETISLQDVREYISRRFDDSIELQSMSVEDVLLFADFMNAEDVADISLIDLLHIAADDNNDDNQIMHRLHNRGFADLEVTGTGNEGEFVRLPPIRVMFHEPHTLKKRVTKIRCTSNMHSNDLMVINYDDSYSCKLRVALPSIATPPYHCTCTCPLMTTTITQHTLP